MNTLKAFSAVCVIATSAVACDLRANEIDDLVRMAAEQQQQLLLQAVQQDVRTTLYSTMFEIQAQKSALQFAQELQLAAVDSASAVEAE